MYYLIIDTETTNSIDDPFCYDVGFAVIDETGKVFLSRSYAVMEIITNKELMASAYFAEKIPHYWEEIMSGQRIMAYYRTIKNEIRKICKQYGIQYAIAHNAKFDYRSLNYTQRLLTCSKYRYFLPYGLKMIDTLKMARSVFGQNPQYVEWCKENDYLTKNGQIRYTAEILYRFISGISDFDEAHTGLADVMIEKEIFVQCVKEIPATDGVLW